MTPITKTFTPVNIQIKQVSEKNYILPALDEIAPSFYTVDYLSLTKDN